MNKEFPQLNLTIEQLKEPKAMHEHSQWECLCTTIERSERSRDLRECLDEIRRVLGKRAVRLDMYMLGYRMYYDDARQLRLDWLDHEIARQRRDMPPELPEGFEYLGRGPVELPEGCDVAGYSEMIGGGWKINCYKVGNSPAVHYAVKRKPKKLGPWHVKETFKVGDKFEFDGATYIIACVGSSKTRCFYQIINTRSGVYWSCRVVSKKEAPVLFELTAEQVAYMLGDRYEFTYVEE